MTRLMEDEAYTKIITANCLEGEKVRSIRILSIKRNLKIIDRFILQVEM